MRWAGKIGVTSRQEVRPGIWEDVITERPKMGTVETRTETFREGENVHAAYSTSTSVSVLSEGPEKIDYRDYVYITHMGVRWQIGSIAMAYPYMTIYLGEEYNGPEPAGPPGDAELD